MPPGDPVDVAFVDDSSVGMEEVEGDRRAASIEVAWAVDRGGRGAVCVPQRSDRVEEGSAERLDTGVDRLEPDPLEVAQADLDRGQVEEVEGAVLEVGGTRRRLVQLLDGRTGQGRKDGGRCRADRDNSGVRAGRIDCAARVSSGEHA